jgi:hypothetical protein
LFASGLATVDFSDAFDAKGLCTFMGMAELMIMALRRYPLGVKALAGVLKPLGYQPSCQGIATSSHIRDRDLVR